MTCSGLDRMKRVRGHKILIDSCKARRAGSY